MRHRLEVLPGDLPGLVWTFQRRGYIAHGYAGKAGEATDIRTHEGWLTARQKSGKTAWKATGGSEFGEAQSVAGEWALVTEDRREDWVEFVYRCKITDDLRMR